MEFEIIDHPADIGFRVVAPRLEESFEKAGRALYSLLLSSFDEEDAVEVKFNIRSEDLESLLYDFLEHLLIMFEVDDIIATGISVSLDESEGHYDLEGHVKGCMARPLSFKRNYDVKAITYHMMEIRETSEGWMIQVIVDI